MTQKCGTTHHACDCVLEKLKRYESALRLISLGGPSHGRPASPLERLRAIADLADEILKDGEE